MSWHLSSSSDPVALGLVDGTGKWSAYGPHYSRRTPGSKTFTGIGQEIVLVTDAEDAVWAVVRQRTPGAVGTGQSRGRSGTTDVRPVYVWRNMLFRNLGPTLSSGLIREATERTYIEWQKRYGELPSEVLRTEIDPTKVRSSNPGCCYKIAGWRNARMVRGKLFLDAPPPKAPSRAVTRPKQLLLAITIILLARNGWALDYCPVVYDECLPRSSDELRAFLPPWGDLALGIINGGGRGLHDLNWEIQGSDCGNVGTWHLQPPDPLDLGMTAATDCPASDQRWVWSMLSLLYSDYSAELQAQSWLEIVGPTVRLALDAGATMEEAAAIAALCNSAPTPVRRWGEEHAWHLPSMLAAYLEHRDTRGRRERVRRITEMLGGA